MLAPKTPFNVTITSQRSYAARALSLTDAKTVSKATGTKINDVVMAICAGALRPYLAGPQGAAEKAAGRFRADLAARDREMRMPHNQVFGMHCPIATQIDDPLERLKSIQKTTNDSKSLAGTVKDVVAEGFYAAWRADPFARPGCSSTAAPALPT